MPAVVEGDQKIRAISAVRMTIMTKYLVIIKSVKAIIVVGVVMNFIVEDDHIYYYSLLVAVVIITTAVYQVVYHLD